MINASDIFLIFILLIIIFVIVILFLSLSEPFDKGICLFQEHLVLVICGIGISITMGRLKLQTREIFRERQSHYYVIQ